MASRTCGCTAGALCFSIPEYPALTLAARASCRGAAVAASDFTSWHAEKPKSLRVGCAVCQPLAARQRLTAMSAGRRWRTDMTATAQAGAPSLDFHSGVIPRARPTFCRGRAGWPAMALQGDFIFCSKALSGWPSGRRA